MAREHDVRILALAGQFDAADVLGLEARLDAALSAGAVRLVVNVARVEFASVAVIGSLLGGRARARSRGGDLVLSAPSPFMRRMLRTLRLDGILRVFPGDGAAVRHLLAGTGGVARPLVASERVRGAAAKHVRGGLARHSGSRGAPRPPPTPAPPRGRSRAGR